eukprot:2651753-Prymnesium_polylepis.2
MQGLYVYLRNLSRARRAPSRVVRNRNACPLTLCRVVKADDERARAPHKKVSSQKNERGAQKYLGPAAGGGLRFLSILWGAAESCISRAAIHGWNAR